MKYLCTGCERLVEPAAFRLDGAELCLTCSRCGAETRARPANAPAQPSAVAAFTPAAAAHTSLAWSPGTPPQASFPPEPPTPLEPTTPHTPTTPIAPEPARVVPLHAVPAPAPAPPEARPPASGGEDPFSIPEGRCPKCISPRPAKALSCSQCGLVFDNYVSSEQQPSPELATAWRELMESWDDTGAHDLALGSAATRGELAAMGRLYRIHLARYPGDPIAQRGRDEVLRLAATTAPLVAARREVTRGMAQSRERRTLVWAFILLLAAALALVGWQFFSSFQQR